MNSKTQTPSPSDREIVTTRLINAPRERVFDAFLDQKQVEKWWGPNGFTTTFRKFETRPGGVWIFTMHGPDGRDYENKITWLEVKRPELLVHTHGGDFDLEKPVDFKSTITLEDKGGKTLVTMRGQFPSTDERNRVVREYKADEGAEQHLGRLDSYLTPFVIERTINAPRERVWEAWTDPKELQKWFGPKGSTMPTCKMDFRVGGMFHYSMKTGEMGEMWGRWIFREIAKPERIVLVQSFSNPQGGIGQHPMAPNWPKETLSTTTFNEKNGKTTIRLEWSAYNATEEERKIFNSSHESMKGGWTGTMDALEKFLTA